ncbi:MAG: IPT/TIG domain-containing protein [Chloroflexi bacterium]|nr:IPT/TIG domain-containing protein [Chloroflexota bacterium]
MDRKTFYGDRENGRERERRDWLLFLLILLLGFICMLGGAQLAINPPASWQVSAGMLSELNPDEGHEIGEVPVGPLRPEVMTPLWDIDTILTPLSEGTLVVAPTVVLGSPPTATPTPQGVAGASPTPSTVPTVLTPSPTPTPTATGTSRPTPTATLTPTPTGTPTPTPTGTPTPTPTFTPTAIPTPTSPPPPTNTPVPPTPTALPPVVQAITPGTRVNTGTVGVTITGQNFRAGCSASLGSVSLAVSSCAPTTILASVPVGIVAGYYTTTVTNPDLQSGALPSAYTATNPIPVITAIRPITWFTTMDVSVIITGTNFRNTGTPGALRADLNGTPLLGVTYVSATTLRATVPSNSAGMGLGAYTLNVTNPGPTDPTGSLANAFTIGTYATTVTCGGAVENCSNAGGTLDGNWSLIRPGGVITIDFGVGQGITDDPGYDMVFYERGVVPPGDGIALDFIAITISSGDGNWYPVFVWDGIPGGVSGTNIDRYAIDGDGEAENEPIPASDLYPSPYPGTGIAIDISALALPAGNYHLVRLEYPASGTDIGNEVDAIQPFY